MLTEDDWRRLFWLSNGIRSGARFAELVELARGFTDTRPGVEGGGEATRPETPAYLIALDLVERAVADRKSEPFEIPNSFVSVREAAAIRGVSRQAINHFVAANRLEYIRRGRAILIRRESLDRIPVNERKRASGRQILV